jgi:hypothetical protein
MPILRAEVCLLWATGLATSLDKRGSQASTGKPRKHCGGFQQAREEEASMKAGGRRQEAGGFYAGFWKAAQTPTKNFSGVHWGGLYRLWFGQKPTVTYLLAVVYILEAQIEAPISPTSGFKTTCIGTFSSNGLTRPFSLNARRKLPS